MWISQCDGSELPALRIDDKFCLVCARSMASLVSGESSRTSAGGVRRHLVSMVPGGGCSRSLDRSSVTGIIFCVWFCGMGTFVPDPAAASTGMTPNEVNVQWSELSCEPSFPQSE